MSGDYPLSLWERVGVREKPWRDLQLHFKVTANSKWKNSADYFNLTYCIRRSLTPALSHRERGYPRQNTCDEDFSVFSKEAGMKTS
jgi:hypothetical protein